ncbi:TonB-dependent receptor [Thalassomonas viridans]|uniref:TonB-dependent receptor n=1 Tax=Thalassomonas viridans TaxID=137584 RepID=A0AAF0CAS2_9GAMM|nr:TonB-dependent receptor [Thalassomonas viridans]WDE08907.1 TonB-dependent receptor [Thalassomonas viridans]WDE08954.1 TonB-dependent receptor [Thalassomonas viridans]
MGKNFNLVLVFTPLMTTHFLYAQDIQPHSDKNVEVISVTAQKRPQSIQDVPIAMSAFGEADLDKIGASSFSDLTVMVPSISVQTGSDAFPVTYIRGIGSNDTSIGAEPSIGVYIDGVYASRLGGAMTELLDIERVEILKGPQGTLFGRNAIGGAISITTKKPSDELAGKIKLEASSFNSWQTSGILNVPLIDDSLYLRAFGSLTQSDGWQKNTLSDENGYQKDRKTAGLKLTWEPTDDLAINFSNTWSDYDDTAGYLDNYLSVFPISPLTSVLDDKKVVNGGLDAFSNPANNQAVNVPVFKRDLKEHWLDITWYITDNLSLTSLSTYRGYTTTSSREYDGTELFIGENILSIEESNSMSQEFRLSSDEGALFWLVGVSAHKEDADLDFTSKFLDLGLLQGTSFNFGAPFTENSLTSSTSESFAFFGDTSFDINDRLTLTLGGRFSYDKKSMNYDNGLHENGAAAFGGFGIIVPTPHQFVDANGNVDLAATKVKDSWTDFSPRLVVDYKLDDTLLYASITKGYKSGAFNSYPSPDATNGLMVVPEARESVAPETVINYELGFKSTLLEQDLTINGSFYYMDYDDLQIFQVVGTLLQLTNAGKAKSSGLEIDSRYYLNNELSFLINATWMDTQYDEYQFAGTDYSGTALLYSPELSASFSLDYQTSVGQLGELNAFLTYSYKGKHFLSPGIEQESYALLNGKITLLNEENNWELALFANNLTNKSFLTSVSTSLASFGVIGANRNTPRSYGLSLSYRF